MLLDLKTLHPAESIGQSSVVLDGGLSLQDKATDSRRHGYIHDGSDWTLYGTQFAQSQSHAEVPNGDLEARIREELIATDGPGGRSKFLPMDRLERVLTRASIEKQLKQCMLTVDLTKTVDAVWKMVETSSGKTSRRRIFAILCLFKMACQITSFIDEGIYDDSLPFIFNDGTPWKVSRNLADKTTQDIVLFLERHIWETHLLELFNQYQGQFLAPYFIFSYDDQKVLNYDVQDAVVLPFVQDKMVVETDDALANIVREGGYSFVRKVKIHPAHCNVSEQRY